jgi:hypothetical protein
LTRPALGPGLGRHGEESIEQSTRGLLTLRRAKAAGLNTSANSQIGQQTIAELPELLEHLIDAGIGQWQLQLTVATGAATHRALTLAARWQFVREHETACPFCDGDLAAFAGREEERPAHVQQVTDDVRALLRGSPRSLRPR